MSANTSRQPHRRFLVNLPRWRWRLQKLLRFAPPKGDIYYGDTAALYEAERTRTSRWHREQKAVETFLDRLPREQAVLDVPLGTGRFIELYQARGHRVSGLDASAEMVAIATARAGEAGIEATTGDATALPWPDASFDIVVSTRFLRHILPLALARQALAEMARVCRGHAIIEIGHNTGRSRWPAENKPMRDRLSHDDIVALFRQQGFEVIDEIQTQKRLIRLRRSVFLLRRVTPGAG